MSGPVTIKVTDKLSCTIPAITSKEWTDVSMIVFDFRSWLGPDQQLSAASNVSLLFNPGTAVGMWAPFPGNNCCDCPDPPENPFDFNPMAVHGINLLPGLTKVGLSLGEGTPGFSYLASFIASASPYPRRKEVGVLININGCMPSEATPMPPVTAPTVTDIFASVALPNSASGDFSIMAGSVIITLPASPVRGQTLCFKDVTGVASGASIRITTTGALIDGQTDFFMFQDYQSVCMYWTGAGWGVQ